MMNSQVNCLFIWTGDHWAKEFDIRQDIHLEARVKMSFVISKNGGSCLGQIYAPPLFGPLKYFNVDLNHIFVTIITRARVYLRPYASLLISKIYMDRGYMYIGETKCRLSDTIFIFSDSRDHKQRRV